MIAQDGTIWWQGYKGEEVVLFDDYRGETNWSHMLRLCDMHATTEPKKGGDVVVNPSWIIFTSNEPWSLWVKWRGFEKSPWERRVTDHFELRWEMVEGERTALSRTIRGQWEEYQDPPDDAVYELSDEQVEDLLSVRPTSRWIPRKRRMAEEVQAAEGLQRMRIRSPAPQVGGVNASLPALEF